MSKNITDDRWKDSILERPVMTTLEVVALGTERSEWVAKYPHIFYHSPESDKIYNLLHRDNRKLVKTLKESGKIAKDHHSLGT